ncbi:hypothetical protein Pcinc_005272 [Petrolisthes cinctipes]|uniref:VWFC domain-containing protein n=1 Tax=Petrolisthes cinctipes TaxID=88211 RepID=A0AAE1KZH6_PETCI|nr:hypothetical protein Pcinc_005272 [Petrolisthes cinctipes]
MPTKLARTLLTATVQGDRVGNKLRGTRVRGSPTPARYTSGDKGCVRVKDGELDGNRLYRHNGGNKVTDVVEFGEVGEHQRQHDVAAQEAAVIGTRRRGGIPTTTNNSSVMDGDTFLTTTTTTTTTENPFRGTCMVGGVEYEDGMRVEAAENNKCESCFCLRGQLSCSNHTCNDPPDTEGCTPIYYEGSCCPVGYTCGDSNDLNQLYQRESRQGFEAAENSPANTQNDQPLSSDQSSGPEEDVNEGTLSEDTTEEIPTSIPVSTSKPPPRLRPMARPSPADIARRRQQSRFSTTRNQPTRPQRPSRPKTSTETMSLSERLKKRNKYSRTTTTPQASTTLTSQLRTSPQPLQSLPISTTPTHMEEQQRPKTTTTTSIPNTTTTKPITPAINQPTSTTTTNRLPPNPTTHKPRLTTNKPRRTTTKFESTTRRERPTTTKVPKGTAFRWSKFRYGGTASSTTPRPSTTRAHFILSSQEVTTTLPVRDSWPLSKTTGTGHVGEVFFVQDRKRLTPFAPFTTTSPPWQKPVEVGVGVNVKGNLDDATVFGPILIYDNRVRRDRQQKAKNTTELPTEEEKVTEVTDVPTEETTILPEEELTEKIVVSDNVAAPTNNDPQDSEKEYEVKVTTMLSPAEPLETTVPPQTNSSTTVTPSTPASPSEPAESPLPTTDDVPDAAVPEKPEDTVDIEYLDLDTHIPTYDITVGSSVMTAGHSHHSPVGVGQVIPVKLEPEDLMPHSRPASRPDSQIIIIKRPDHTETVPEEPIMVTEVTEILDQGVSEGETEKPPAQTVTPDDVDEAQQPEHKQEEGNEDLKMEHKSTTEDEVLEAEHKAPETESASEAPRPSILSALFNILTQTERPRPDPTRTSRPKPDRPIPEPSESRPTRFRPERPIPPRLRPEQPGNQRPFRPRPERPGILRPRPDIRNDRPRPERLPPPSRLPFRPRPRPNGRPDFVPPRFRFTTPTPGPDIGTEEETTTEPSSPASASPAEEESSPTPGLPFRFTPPLTETLPRLPPQFTPSTTESTTQVSPQFTRPTTEIPARVPPQFTRPTTEIPARVSPQFTRPTIEIPARASPQFTRPTTEIPARVPPQFTRPTTEIPARVPPQFTRPTTEIPARVPPQFTRPTTEIPARVPPQFTRLTSESPAPSLFIPPFLQATPAEPRPGVVNPNPIPLFILPDPIHTGPTLRPFIPPPAISSVQPASISLQGLPSQPVLESGFQGMRKESEGVTPNIDIHDDYDTQGEPTLPPSLPNLKIIPFVAADALTGPDRPFSSEDPRSTPRPSLLPILPLKEDHEVDTGETSTDSPSTTTPTTTTTTSISQTTTRRPPIIPPRRPLPPRPAIGDATTRRPFLPFGRPGKRPTRPVFKPQPTPASREDQTTADSNPTLSTRPDFLFAFRDRPSTRPPFIPPRRTSSLETTTQNPTTTTSTVPPPPPPPPSTPFRPKPTTILPVQTSRPIDSNDISNLLLQDVFQLPPGQSFSVSQGTPKPSRPVKVAAVLPEIPAAVRDQLPLATDPILASGLLKLSGCNIYGRMYVVKDRIPELSAKCKECRCTPVGVQCLPIC